MGFKKKNKETYGMPFKEKVKFEIFKIKSQKGFKKKFEYIYEYYKLWIFGILIFGLFVFALVDAQIQNSKEDLIYVAVLNSGIVSNNESTLMNDFAEYMEMNPKKQKATLDVSYTIDSDMSTEQSYNSSMKLYAQFASKSVDAIIANPDMFNFYCNMNAFHHLDEVLPADFVEAHSEDFVTGIDEDGNEFIMGLDLSNCKRAEDLLYRETPILSIISNSENLDRTIEFVKFLYME